MIHNVSFRLFLLWLSVFILVILFTGGNFYVFGQAPPPVSSSPNISVEILGPAAPPPPGGGGSTGGGEFIISTSVEFSGRAYPLSRVTLLKDAQVVVRTVAGPDANFFIAITNIAAGNYVFSIYGTDRNGEDSPPLAFSVTITQNVITRITGIFLAPTISADKSVVKKGDTISILGQSAPAAQILIGVHSDAGLYNRVTTDMNGVYFYDLDTTPLDYGGHTANSKSFVEVYISPDSKVVSFEVGTKNISATKTACPPKGDLNNDCRVNLVDFSILAYWYNRPNFPPKYDISGDAKIDLIDFSIMAYYWTG